MPSFHDLKVTAIEKTTRDAVVVSLTPTDDADFSFTQGQHLTFRRSFDGEELRRSYSICSGRGDGTLQVGIKRVEGGSFSTWANTDLKVGDTLEVMPPVGSFHAPTKVDAPHIVGFAAGSGITPILSILRTELDENPQATFTLVYGNRNINSIMFRETLADLKDIYMGRLSVLHILTDGSEDIDLFKGRITEAKCTELFRQWIDVHSISMAYLCGPEGMTDAVTRALHAHGVPKEKIRRELFTSAQPGRAKNRPKPSAATAAGITARVTLDGETRSFTMDPSESLLEATRKNQIDAPFACCAGVCSTCKAKVQEGEVEMAANHALEDYEVEQGYVLTCQSFVKSPRVVFDYDQAGH
ncbi:2Fe-2S iron-sulfur cluster-binding protein [Cognatiyoonia sp. IB215182]|uniref:2Fe-2S iron-sulfur cluster-binding protein n=1 Tax=Cognatiyoonia sp. IB215182 TaxID=3097353 RepID=UPI002A119D95|nr:2Fe-2S iron-sulfur cluster-binding protein [Cognatiyoonia sp. IB215182]MDX8352973.1 2Fe-2S iron-sulfur cluster-binding protein [Cognatiyoonia sp. IB215182]